MANWSQGGQGALGGAASGAAIGSVAGPYGTAIGAGAGAIIGGLGGLFGGGDERDQYQKQLEELANHYGNMSAPQLGQAAGAANSQLTANRAALIAQLEAQSRGEGPSAAALMMQRGADQASRNMSAEAAGAGGRGVNAGAAMRNATQQGAQMNLQNLQNTGVIRAQEQLNAQGQLGQNIAQGINSDNQLSQFNVGQQNQFTLSQAQLEANQRALAANMQLQATNSGSQMATPGFGTSLLAAGAQSIPTLVQMYQAHQQQQQQQQLMDAMGTAPQSTPHGYGNQASETDPGYDNDGFKWF